MALKHVSALKSRIALLHRHISCNRVTTIKIVMRFSAHATSCEDVQFNSHSFTPLLHIGWRFDVKVEAHFEYPKVEYKY